MLRKPSPPSMPCTLRWLSRSPGKASQSNTVPQLRVINFHCPASFALSLYKENRITALLTTALIRLLLWSLARAVGAPLGQCR